MERIGRVFSSYRGPITNKYPSESVTLQKIASRLKTDIELAEKIKEIRSATDPDTKKGLKEKLPYVTVSGTFSYRKSENLINHSGYITADLDHIGTNGEIKTLQDKIRGFIEPALMFVSPSGDGLKSVFCIDIKSGSHIEYYYAVESFFKKELDLKTDPQCKDVSRATFLAYDPDLYLSDNPAVLDRKFIDTYKKELPVKKDNPVTTVNLSLYDSLKQWANTKTTFIKGSRNDYIVALAGSAHRFGMDKTELLQNLQEFTSEDFPSIEIEKPVESIYNNDQWFGTVKNIQDLDLEVPEKPSKTITPLLSIEGFPKDIQDVINECTRVYGTHRDFWAGSILAATALAAGNSYRVMTKYGNSPILWIALVAKTGTGKSEPLDFAFKYMHDQDTEALKEYESNFAEFERVNKMDKKTRTEEGYTKKPEKPIFRQLILSDCTPESMYEAHKFNPRGIGMLRDELKGWIDDFGRYNKSGEDATWLQSWSEKSITINRKAAGAMKIPTPFMTVTGGLTPDTLSSLAASGREVNGFMQRFCFIFPDKTKRPYTNNEKVRHQFTDCYNRYISNLLSVNPITPQQIYLSPEAEDLYLLWDNKNTDMLNAEDDGYTRGMLAKMPPITLRLALVLFISNWATGDTSQYIEPRIIKAAIEMGEYFRLTGEKVRDELQKNAINGLNTKNVTVYLNGMGLNDNQIGQILHVSRAYVGQILKKSGLKM